MLKNKLPRILFIVDVRNWAYDFRAKEWKKRLHGEFDIKILYLSEHDQKNPKPIFDQSHYDGIVFFYHRAICSSVLNNTPINKSKVAICINNGKWSFDGSRYTFEKYFQNIQFIFSCNQSITNEFSKYPIQIMPLSQVVNDNVFLPLGNEIKNSNFTIGWCGNPSNQLKNMMWLKRACIDANVKFDIATDLTQKKLNKWYNNIDAVACISYPDYEGGPNMILEAGACKVPIISTPVGLARDIIQHNHNGIIIPHFQLDRLIFEISRLSKDRTLQKQLSDNMYDTIKRYWTYDTRIYEIKNALKRLIS